MEPGLDAVRRRRAELRESLYEVERALAAPASGRAAAWGEQVHAALAAMAGDFREHIAVTEGPDGLHHSILDGDLRLANAVDALTAEHVRIAATLTDLVGTTQSPIAAEDVADVREQATHLLTQVIRHRQRGSDLIYEAYATDIGGGD
jgi:hypothetical protein